MTQRSDPGPSHGPELMEAEQGELLPGQGLAKLRVRTWHPDRRPGLLSVLWNH